jgi:hypothetical protein
MVNSSPVLALTTDYTFKARLHYIKSHLAFFGLYYACYRFNRISLGWRRHFG